MKKIKLVIDPRRDDDVRDFDGKLRVEQFAGSDVYVGDVPDSEQFAEAADGAGWSDDPGTGRAILMPDGRELLNPTSVAPPVSVSSEPSVNDLVERALARHYKQLSENDEIDTIEDADDFGEDEDFVPFSQYEIVLRDEAPAIPKGAASEEAIVEVVQAEADLPKVDPLKKKPKPKAAVSDLDEEGAP